MSQAWANLRDAVSAVRDEGATVPAILQQVAVQLGCRVAPRQDGRVASVVIGETRAVVRVEGEALGPLQPVPRRRRARTPLSAPGRGPGPRGGAA